VMALWATLTSLTALLAHAMIVYGTPPTPPAVKCVGIGTKSYFSVIIKDNSKIKDATKMRVTSASGGPALCDKTKLKVEYFNDDPTDGTIFTAADTTALTSGATEGTHTYTRVLVNLAECATHTETTVDATDDNLESSSQKFEARLEMGTNDWAYDDAYKLECTYEQSVVAETLEMTSSIVTNLVDNTPKLEVELSVTDSGGNPITSGSAVPLGDIVKIKAKITGNINVETAFKSCKVCVDADCNNAGDDRYLIEQYQNGDPAAAAKEQLNCLPTSLSSNPKFQVTVPTGTDKDAELQFPAFRFANAADSDKLVLQCTIAICKAGTNPNTACRSKCGTDNGLPTGTAVASFGRRRRSVDDSPLESAASIAIHVVAPKTASCGPPSPVSRAARRANCTHGATIGSVCRQKCDLGFESAGGSNAATRICQETITDRIDDFYFGVAPKWNPGKTECVDINECLKFPCPSTKICENTQGSYHCL